MKVENEEEQKIVQELLRSLGLVELANMYPKIKQLEKAIESLDK